MVQGALKKLLRTSCPHPDAMNYVVFDMGTSTLNEVADECAALPLGYDKKTVVAENCTFLEKTRSKYKYQKGDSADALLAFLAKPDEAIDLYLLVYSDTLDEKNDFYAALEQSGAHINSVSQFSKEQWNDYITRYFERREGSISRMAVYELTERLEGDYARFLSEAPKLLAYANGEEITPEMIELLVAAPLEDDAFHLSNALTKGDVKGALKIYGDLKTQSVEPISLIRLLGNQFRFLNQVNYLRLSGLNNSQIAGALQASQMRVNISIDNLKRMRDGAVNEALEGLYDCELSIMSGTKDADLAFTLFLANFSL